MKKARIYAIILVVFVTLVLPFTAFAAGNVPQKILDLRSSIVRVVSQFPDGIGRGTGFAIGTGEPVQYIATNYHVVENATSIVVWYGNQAISTATVERQLPNSDVCVLKLDDPIYNMKPLAIDDSGKAKVGDQIFALGFPGSADNFSETLTANADYVTVTDGIISSLKSSSIVQGGNQVNFYQINAAINPGNSGGPLLNANGEVIGINSLVVRDAQNTNAAINISELTGLLKQSGIPYKTTNFFSDNLWIIISASGAAAIVIVVLLVAKKIRFGRKKDKKNIPLETWLQSAGGRVPFDTALFMLEPVIRRLAKMHELGQSYLDVCPEKVVVDPATKKAYLAEPDGSTKKTHAGSIPVTLTTMPGFSPAEQYKASGDIGSWTDVYAVGALLYRMVIGKNPPDVFSRMENDDELSENINSRYIDENLKMAWLKALSPSIEQRVRDCGALASELYPYAHAEGAVAMDEAAWQPPVLKEKKRKLVFKFKKKWLPVYIVIAILIAAGGYFGWVEFSYQQVLKYTDYGDYQKAMDNIEKVPLLYKDTVELAKYDSAGVDMLNGNYYGATALFMELGDYRNSREMITEVEYQRAKGLLNVGWYDDAKQAFINLGSYKDSEFMASQADYEKALKLLEDENYLDAFNLLKSIQNYSDVSDIMDGMVDIIYNEGVRLYRSGSKNQASQYFEAVPGYQDADYFSKLIDAQNNSSQEGYQELLNLAGFEDAIDIIMNDTFIYYYLNGYWSDGNYYFKMYEDDEGWSSEYTLPWLEGKYYTITNGVFQKGDTNNWKDQYKFTFVSPNEMRVFCYKNNRSYEMYRE